MIKVRLRNLSRIILFVLSVLLLTFIGLKPNYSVLAEESSLPCITVENKTVHRGQTFEVEVNLEENPGLLALKIQLDYNKDVMSLVGFERGNALPAHTFTTTNIETSEGYLIDDFNFLWDATKQDKSTGTLVKLIFESKISAPVGDYPINITYDKQNTTSDYGKQIDVNITNGTVTLTTGAFKVVYKNYDGTILQERDYNSGAVPSYTGPKPTRPTDDKYAYKFVGWKGAVSNEANTICYVADYSLIPQEYQVIFYVDGEYFSADIYAYNEFIDLTIAPKKKNHNFSGWYLDENFTQKVSAYKMPAYDIVLYGYLKYNIREDNVPEIDLSLTKIETNVAYIDVNVSNNSGLSGLVLTLSYNRDALEFIGFDRGDIFNDLQFDITNTENGYNSDPFKFYWESVSNTYETGKLLTLKFKIKEDAQAGLYNVTFNYNEESDATYFAEDNELWYTKLNIKEAKVPIGTINHWQEETDSGIIIDVTTSDGHSPETILEIKRVTEKIQPEEGIVKNAAGNGMEVKDIYSIKLLLNGEEVEPVGTITVKIQLTTDQQQCRTIKVFNIAENNEMVEYASEVEDGFVIFETEHLSNWAIVGNAQVYTSLQTPTNASILIISLSLLIIAIMGLVLILKAKLRKKK